MIIRVHGSRGSHPVATTPSRIENIKKDLFQLFKESGAGTWDEFQEYLKDKPRHLHQIYGGNTTCIEVESDLLPMPLFFDAGTGLTSASTDPNSSLTSKDFMIGKGEAALFFTHTHWDHISGLVTIPQIFMDNNIFHFYGVHEDLEQRLRGLFDPKYFPVPYSLLEPRARYHQIALGRSVRLGPVKIDHHPQSHPGGSFAYRVSDGKKVFVLATDTDLKNTDEPHMKPGDNIYSNADILVIDAHFSPEDYINKEDFGHTHLETAIDFGVRENTKVLYLFHQSPFYSDEEISKQYDRAWDYIRQNHPESKTEIKIAIDGDVINLS